jgi:hypothetical protein
MLEKLCQVDTEHANQPTTTVTLEMPVDLFEHVKKTAELDGTDISAVINCFVQQGLINSNAEIKRMEFAEHAKHVLEKQGIEQSAIDEIFTKILF